MHRFTLFVVLAVAVANCHGAVQVQIPEAAELQQSDDDLQAQVRELQKNVTDIWNYILELRSAVTHHLTHLRQHQVELESSVHRMEHYHESDASSSHHHSGEQHSHSGDYHSHGDEHSHGSDHSHSHGDEHSHGSDHSHSHSGEQHSHSGEHHSHSGEHGHYSHSHSHSSSHDHGSEDSHSHGHDHKDSHESEDFQQQTQQVENPVAEPIVTATSRQEHYHHHHHQSSRSGGSTDSMNLLDEHNLHHHHHGHHHDSRSRNRTVELPRVSDHGLYDLAMCRMLPNSALPEDQQQNVVGTVTMWQKKSGGPLNFHVRLQGFDVGGHHGHHQQSIQTEEDNETPQAVVHRHGFHIHASGDLSNGCQSTGPHYNPKNLNHGGPFASVRHVGDLGNIECDEHGNTNILFSDNVASLRGQYSVIGKAIVVHAQEDDLGLGGNEGSLQHGNAGPRLSCCVIQKIDKLPLRQYKVMKSAVQYKNQ